MRGRQPDLARMTITQKPAAVAQPRRRQDSRPAISGPTSGEAVPAQTTTVQPVISHAVSPKVHLGIGTDLDLCVCLDIHTPDSVEPQPLSHFAELKYNRVARA